MDEIKVKAEHSALRKRTVSEELRNVNDASVKKGGKKTRTNSNVEAQVSNSFSFWFS